MRSHEIPGLEARRFATTPWTEVLLAREQDTPGACDALEHLCRLYWYPIYGHIRQSVPSPQDAEDLTQEFFRLLIEKNYLGAVDRQRGKFRTFLLVAVNRFVINQRKHASRLKRGGGQTIISLDVETAENRLQSEPTSGVPPDISLSGAGHRTVLDRALARLQAEHVASGKAQHLKPCRSS